MIYISARYVTPPPYSDESYVEGVDEFGNVEVARRDHTVFRLPEHGPQGFVDAGGVIAEYVAPPEPEPTITCPTCGGSGVVPA